MAQPAALAPALHIFRLAAQVSASVPCLSYAVTATCLCLCYSVPAICPYLCRMACVLAVVRRVFSDCGMNNRMMACCPHSPDPPASLRRLFSLPPRSAPPPCLCTLSSVPPNSLALSQFILCCSPAILSLADACPRAQDGCLEVKQLACLARSAAPLL
eukprot:1943408-Rhodomonas_salina.1